MPRIGSNEPMRPRLLIVDDDASFLRACESSLSPRYRIACARTIKEASDFLVKSQGPSAKAEDTFSALILDYWLGSETAEHFLDLVPHSLPCVIISGDATKDVAIKMLNRHVFALIEKPIDFETLSTTIARALTLSPRKSNPKSTADLRFHIDFSSRRVHHGESFVQLTPNEIAILALLVEANGATVSRDSFTRAIWGRVQVSRSALDTHILNLKRKLPQIEPHLHAVYGSGYLIDVNRVSFTS